MSLNEPLNGLTRRQIALVEKMATFPYPTLKAAAEELGIPYPTAKRWNQKTIAFQRSMQDAYKTEESEVKADLRRRIQALSGASVSALATGLKSSDSNTQVRVANAVLDRVLGKPREKLDIGTEDDKPINVRLVIDSVSADDQ